MRCRTVRAWPREVPRRTSVLPRLGPRTEERVTLPACRGTPTGKHLGRAVDDQRDDEGTWDLQPNPSPVRAQDLLDEGGAQIVRSLVLSEDHEELRWSYGCSIEEARTTLSCRDLATLRMWDVEALVDAATVLGTEEERLGWGMESRVATSRRIGLAVSVTGVPTRMTPADGILFLRGVGIPVCTELVDAVAVMTIRLDQGTSQYRELKGLSPADVAAVPRLVSEALPDGLCADDSQSAGPEPASHPGVAVHRTSRRSNPLDGPLALAKQRAADPSSWQSVWAELVRLAESEEPPIPLIGFVEGEGVKYRNLSDQGEEIEFLNREALRARMSRERRGRR